MQNELDNWLNKYDDFMETQNAEKADMTDLQERFIKLKGNFSNSEFRKLSNER